MIKRNSQNCSDMWIYGRHAVKAALENPRRVIRRLVTLNSCWDFLRECGGLSVAPEIVDDVFFNSIFGKNAVHQGCAVYVKKLREYSIEELANDELDQRPLVFLDRVSDPQNIGSILRASAVFGARAVVMTENHSPELTPAAIKTASGAAEFVPLIRVVNLVQTINFLKKHGFWCIGLDEKANQKIYETSMSGKFILVIGNEGDGMRRLTRESCDFLLKLPCSGNFSTLNAAQAATISLYEIQRQKEVKR
ncbi:MAG: 23S rRNA (guanosine(2251)-2'-O)-methyltransferase RlmB [Holosporaceae bacterium]|jgi:23S rRNA (guanosine2251-2'-O)-methyltransferase|nr:23S rRNA (guanosine(2251)-2'-O)-methyltransferase RlmB [Holosporaceae bacterium]